jgi:hypothetical protein
MPLERHILDTSIESPRHCTLAHIAGVNERRYGRFKVARFEISAQRMEFHHQLDSFQYILDRLQKSVGALNSGVTSGKPELVPEKSKVSLKRLEGRLRSDAEELTRHIQSTVLLMTRLEEGERHAEEVGDALGNSLQAMSTALRRNGFSQDDEDLMHTSVSLISTPSPRSEESDNGRSPMAEELANFCDAVGNFKVMRERIDELHLEKHEQEERRDFLGDQELKLEKGSEKFLLRWHQSLATAKKDLQQAEEAVKHARKLCEAAEVSIPSWAEPDQAFDEGYQENTDPVQYATLSPPASIMLQHSSGNPVGSSTNSSGVVMVAASSQMSNSLQEFDLLKNPTAPDDKVARWIEDVQLDVPDPPSGLFSAPTREDDASILHNHRFEHRSAEQIRRSRSRSSLPSTTRPRLNLKSPASCPSVTDAARNSGQTLKEIQPELTPLVAPTPVLIPDVPQNDDDITEFPPISEPPQDR